MSSQRRTVRKPKRHRFEDSRSEIRRTLRLHKAGTVAVITAICGGFLVAAGGVLAAGIASYFGTVPGSADAISQLRVTVMALGAWVLGLHYLLRCYRSGIEVSGDLLRQLSDLEQSAHAIREEERSLRRLEDAALAPEPGEGEPKTPTQQTSKRMRREHELERANIGSADNVVEFKDYQRV